MRLCRVGQSKHRLLHLASVQLEIGAWHKVNGVGKQRHRGGLAGFHAIARGDVCRHPEGQRRICRAIDQQGYLRGVAEDHDLSNSAGQRIFMFTARRAIAAMQDDPTRRHQPGNRRARIECGLMPRLQYPAVPAEKRKPGFRPMLDNLTVEDVAKIDQPRDSSSSEGSSRRAACLPAACGRDGGCNPIGEHRRFVEIVRDQQDRHAQACAAIGKLAVELPPGDAIDGGKRLVEKQHGGSRASARATATRCCCPPESCAGRRCSSPARLEQLASSSRARTARVARGQMAECRHDVALRRQVRKQRVMLEHEPTRAMLRRWLERRRGIEPDLARASDCVRWPRGRGRRYSAASSICRCPTARRERPFRRARQSTSRRAEWARLAAGDAKAGGRHPRAGADLRRRGRVDEADGEQRKGEQHRRP